MRHKLDVGQILRTGTLSINNTVKFFTFLKKVKDQNYSIFINFYKLRVVRFYNRTYYVKSFRLNLY